MCVTNEREESVVKHHNLFRNIYSTMKLHVSAYNGHRQVSIPIKGSLYRVSQEEGTKLPEGVPYVKLYRYNPKHLYPKLNGYGDNGQRKVWVSVVSTYCKPSMTSYSSTAQARERETTS